MIVYQKKYNLLGNWGGDWIEITKGDVIDNLVAMHGENYDVIELLVDKLCEGKEIEVGLFNFRRVMIK